MDTQTPIARTTRHLPTQDEVTLRLLDAPVRVFAQAASLLDARDARAGLEEELELRRLAISEAVAAETGADGKAVYSNETKRAAETARRLQLDARSCELAAALRTAKLDVARMELNLRLREDEFRSLRSIASLMAREA